MTSIEFKKAIHSNSNYFFHYLQAVLFILVGVSLCSFFYLNTTFGKHAIATEWAVIATSAFIFLGIYMLSFVSKKYCVQKIATNKMIDENTEIVQKVKQRNQVIDFFQDKNFFCYKIQVRQPNWKDIFFAMNN